MALINRNLSSLLSGYKSNTTDNKKKQTVSYNPNTDYQAVINDAVAKGDYTTAAKAEQERNAKIDATGSSYSKTNNYSQYLNGGSSSGNSSGGGSTNSQYTSSSYTPKGSYFDSGLPDYAASQIKYLQDLYTTAMANGNIDAANQAHDDAQAIRAKYGYDGGEDGSEFILLPQEKEQFQYEERQPTFESKYDPEVDRLLSEILNRDAFSYDVTNDPLYQQYAQMYKREGDRAMREAMAEAAAGAGGMNTYAMTAASQANNYYNSMLNDKIPELYQAAYEMYLGEIDGKVRDLGLLERMDETQYSRYRDTMNDWKNDRDFAYGVYRDKIGDSQWQQQFDYGAYRDNVADSQWNKQFDYNSDWADKEWDYNTSIYDKETAKEEVWKYISLGITPSAELIAKAGMSETDVALAVAAAQAENNSTKRSSSDYTYKGPSPAGNPPGAINEPTANPVSLGIGPISDETLLALADAGVVIIDEKGNIRWADGWNKDNYREALTNKNNLFPSLNFSF